MKSKDGKNTIYKTFGKEISELGSAIKNETTAVTKSLLKKVKKAKSEVENTKTIHEIKNELFDQDWRNDTISPLTAGPFWAILENLIPKEENVLSAMFATTTGYEITQKRYTFLLTNKQIYECISIDNKGKVVRKLDYDKIKAIKLWQDIWNSSQTYADIYWSKFKIMYLESSDPTSTIHFKYALKKCLNGEFAINCDPENQLKAGHLKKFLTRSFHHKLNEKNVEKNTKG